MINALFRWSLLRKFCATVQHEGLAHAVEKARIYASMIWRGTGRSAVSSIASDAPAQGGHYLTGTWRMLTQSHAFHVTCAPAVLSRRRKIALIGDLNLPQCRKYRVEQLAQFWRGRNVEVVFAHYQDVPRCVHALQDATHLMEYRLTATAETTMYRYEARRLRLPVLYDLDDPLFSVSAYEGYCNMKVVGPELQAQFVAQAPGYLDMMNGADIVSVSTPALAQHPAFYCPRPIYLRRNFADQSTLESGQQAMALAVKKRAGSAQFRVAFASGSQGHEADFDVIRDDVIAFLDGADTRVLVLLGHFDKSRLSAALRARVEVHEFSGYASYLHNLAQADCAIMPLADDMFNRCKSAARVLDAAAVGVPAIVGSVSDMAQVVVPETTGVIADGAGAWCAALNRLAHDKSATRAMGRAARKAVETRWSGKAMPHMIAPELLDWVQG